MIDLTPKMMVKKLNRYIIGQHEAKKTIAIALRNRWRAKRLNDNLKKDAIPSNILMVGPTGVGKTEIARRIAKLTNSPFVKVEATQFTEVGYVGKNVDSIIKDLVDEGVKKVKQMVFEKEKSKALFDAKVYIASALSKDRFLRRRRKNEILSKMVMKIRRKMRNKCEDARFFFYHDLLEKGYLDEHEVVLAYDEEIKEKKKNNDHDNNDNNEDNDNSEDNDNNEDNDNDDESDQTMEEEEPKKKKKYRRIVVECKIPKAIKIIIDLLIQDIVSKMNVIKKAKTLVEEDGIVFIDEIDKIIGSDTQKKGDVNKEGVQRELLALIDGTNVETKCGNIKTNKILFIASGAFQLTKPSELIPELQGRLPIKVELHSLNEEQIFQILKEKNNSLATLYVSLIATEDVGIHFSDLGLREIARQTIIMNNMIENIGVRRLHTIFHYVLKDISYVASDISGNFITINDEFVRSALKNVKKPINFNRYII